MEPIWLIFILLTYLVVIFFISRKAGSKNTSSEDFYHAGRRAPWIIVAIGMIGASLSGVTFISVPGWVGERSMSYMQMVLGYFVGYLIISFILLPIYYRANIASIYQLLESKLGYAGQWGGAGLFLISRSLGAALRLYLVAIVLQKFAFESFGVPFWVTALLTLVIIWLYTYRSGIQAVIWTDLIQTIAMISVLIVVVIGLAEGLNLGVWEIVPHVLGSDYGQLLHFENGWSNPLNFFKQVLSGMFITIVMTGLDQDMMQKNLSCKSSKEARKNMLSFSTLLIFINFLFLTLGVLMFMYYDAFHIEIPTQMTLGKVVHDTDMMFPNLAINHMGLPIAMLFFVGLIAASFSSADSALTALTTSVCVDILGMDSDQADEHIYVARRRKVHFLVAIVLYIIILFVWCLNSGAIIATLFKLAAYTYGPLLGYFVYALSNRSQRLAGPWVLVIGCMSPFLSFLIESNSEKWFNGYQFDFEILIINGLLCYIGLRLLGYFKSTTEYDV